MKLPLFKRAMVILLFIVTLSAFLTWYNLYREDQEMLSLEAQDLDLVDMSENTKNDEIIVYVSGEVATPGLVTIKPKSRVAHALELCGGVLTSADVNAVNMATTLTDGMHIYVPEKKIPLATEIEHNASDKINLNTANVKELDALPGIGPAMAERILKYREQNGKFRSIEDIKKVKGIGEGRYEKLKDKIKI